MMAHWVTYYLLIIISVHSDGSVICGYNMREYNNELTYTYGINKRELLIYNIYFLRQLRGTMFVDEMTLKQRINSNAAYLEGILYTVFIREYTTRSTNTKYKPEYKP